MSRLDSLLVDLLVVLGAVVLVLLLFPEPAPPVFPSTAGAAGTLLERTQNL